MGIDNWQELDDEYAFVYTNPEKGGKKVLVKCLAMHDKLLVDALAEGADEPVHLQIRFDFLLLSLHSQLDFLGFSRIFLSNSSYELWGLSIAVLETMLEKTGAPIILRSSRIWRSW